MTLNTSVQLLRKKRLLELLGCSKSTLHELLKRDSHFPRPRYLPGGRIPYWAEDQISAYVATRMQNSPAKALSESSRDAIDDQAWFSAEGASQLVTIPPPASSLISHIPSASRW